ncbi:hypothetical protein AB0J63_36225 [Streptosporangium canum]|uniref:hypothetical protein n=1 Tax=Streptosporangium canum TaxID=324952 RepID=UPI003417DB87
MPRSGMCQRGSPRCVFTFVPPDLFLLIAWPHAAIEARIASFNVEMNTLLSSGWRRFS